MTPKLHSPQTFTKIYPSFQNHAVSQLAPTGPARVYWSAKTLMSKSASNPEIRDLATLADLERVLVLEKEVWELDAADATPLTLAVALKAAGSIWLGAFDDHQLVGFAMAFLSLERGRVGLHSHMLAVRA